MKTSQKLYLKTLAVFALAAIFSMPVLAQDEHDHAEEAGGSADSTVVYPAAYFSEYAPNTAQDMLNRIPGVGSVTGGGSPVGGGGNAGRGGRGLGGGGGGDQILVNGKRTAG
ncbi:MAG: hypothetical protein WD772_03155, partial [Pseudohongiellaceae bacterium]